jgi:hypothetical protein
MLELFTTRELALFSWLFIIIIWLFLKKSRRHSLKDVFKKALTKKLVIVYLLMLSWITLSVYILMKVHIWDWNQLKTTILWAISYAFVGLVSINKILKSKAYFKDAAKELLTFSVVLEILVGFHTFSYWIEMILIPIATILTGCIVYAGNKVEYAPVKKLFNSLLAFMGLVIIGFSIYWVITNFKHFAAINTFMDTIISSLLTLLFLPFLYILTLYMQYETGFIGLETALKGNPKLIGFAKRKAVFHFKFHVTNFHRWKNSLFLHPVNSKQEIVASIKKLKELNDIERNPPPVNPAVGWSPYKAKNFLINDKLGTGFYINHYENEWGASSNYLDLEEGEIMPNRIAYYVTGNQLLVKSLKLCLSVNAPNHSVSAITKLAQIAKSLYKEALQKPLPSEIEAAILNKRSISVSDENRKIAVLKEDWPTQRGYNLDFEIFLEA